MIEGNAPCGGRGEPAAAVVAFWREAGAKGNWFDKNAAFDRAFRERFLNLHQKVTARHHDGWMQTSEGALALLILTDQFPRNAFVARPGCMRPMHWPGAMPGRR